MALIEEIGKLAVVSFIIFRLKSKYSLNGLLIGASVGAGFAAIESAGYAFTTFTSEGVLNMLANISLRAILSPGGHVAYMVMAYVLLLRRRAFPHLLSSIGDSCLPSFFH